MAKRYRRARRYYAKAKHRASKMTLPIAPIAGLAIGMRGAVDAGLKGNFVGTGGVIDWLAYNYTGYSMTSGDFQFNRLKQGLLPLLAGLAVHKVAGMAGINKILARAKVPLLRV